MRAFAGLALRSPSGFSLPGFVFAVSVGLVACGGAEKPRFPPADSASEGEEAADSSWDTGEPAGVEPDHEADEEAEDKGPKPPEFTEGMTVEQAISAVSSDYDYVGIDQEVLGKPLKNIETYKDCKVGQATHFKVRIAVWDGKVVGADVTAASKALAECVDRVVRQLVYAEKELSMNTVVYSF